MNTEQIVDLSVVGIYLLAVTALGIYVGRKKSGSAEDYFLGGRQFSWVLIGFSLFATNINMTFFVAWTGKAARSGFAAFNPELLGGLMLTISAVIFIPLYLRSRIYTIPQFLELRFNTASKVIFGGTFVLQNVLASPIAIYTAALGILSLFGWEVNQTNVVICGICIACTVGVYAIFGGLTSVVITDMVQVVIMILGGLVVAIVGLWKVGGIGVIYEAMPQNIYPLVRKNAKQVEAVAVGKVFAAGNLIWGILAAPIFMNMNSALFDLAMTVAGFMVIPSGTVFLFGRFNKRLNGKGATTTLALGMVIGFYYVATKNFPVLHDFMLPALRGMHFYHVFPLVFLLLTAVLFGVSYLTEAPPVEKLECIKPMEVEIREGPALPWYRTFKFWWAIYIAIFVAFYLVF